MPPARRTVRGGSLVYTKITPRLASPSFPLRLRLTARLGQGCSFPTGRAKSWLFTLGPKGGDTLGARKIAERRRMNAEGLQTKSPLSHTSLVCHASPLTQVRVSSVIRTRRWPILVCASATGSL